MHSKFTLTDYHSNEDEMGVHHSNDDEMDVHHQVYINKNERQSNKKL
jgi:hypothetical protein